MATKITVNNNGSLKIEGEFEIVDKEGNVYGLQGREVVSICRCGLSQNKPFCDGSHKGHFEHEAKAFDLTGSLFGSPLKGKTFIIPIGSNRFFICPGNFQCFRG